MRFKLDENLGLRTAALFAEHGHNAKTVFQEDLSGATDRTIFDACVREGRCLVSLDLDFSDVVRFPPHTSSGIAVLRLPKGGSATMVSHLASNLLAALDREPIGNRLWIVETNRIRVHQYLDPDVSSG